MPELAPLTHKQKMLAGELYLATDPELTAEHLRAQALVERLNATPISDLAIRLTLARELFGSIGDDVVLKPDFRCDYGYNISIGTRTFINYNCVFLDCNRITIGVDVQIAPGVHIYTAAHPLDAATRRSGLEYARPVTIADNVWLGGGAILCPGIEIGENTIVGAGSVVTRSLPANIMAVGNPCRLVREL